jgi:hypothetical protein
LGVLMRRLAAENVELLTMQRIEVGRSDQAALRRPDFVFQAAGIRQ